MVLLGGLVATTVNVLLSYGWRIYRLALGTVPEVWRLKEEVLREPGTLAATNARFCLNCHPDFYQRDTCAAKARWRMNVRLTPYVGRESRKGSRRWKITGSWGGS